LISAAELIVPLSDKAMFAAMADDAKIKRDAATKPGATAGRSSRPAAPKSTVPINKATGTATSVPAAKKYSVLDQT
jgi:hypothetical protein